MSLHHTFDVAIATEFKSIELAILIHHFQFFISRNRNLKRNYHQERTWTYQTLEEIAAVYPYWSRDQVNRLLRKAVEMKILKKGNFNQTTYDRTCWYAFSNEDKFLPHSNNVSQMAKSPDGGGEIATPIPDIEPDIEKKECKEKVPKSQKRGTARIARPPRSARLSALSKVENFKYRMLTDEELDKIQVEFPNTDIRRVYSKMLDYYVRHGEDCKNHARKLRDWCSREKSSREDEAKIAEENNALLESRKQNNRALAMKYHDLNKKNYRKGKFIQPSDTTVYSSEETLAYIDFTEEEFERELKRMIEGLGFKT